MGRYHGPMRTPPACGIPASLPADEDARLDALASYAILDTLPEQAYNDLVGLAAQVCGVPTALISLIDEQRQWFKARVGLDVSQTPREQAFCAHAILRPDDVMEVPDATQDPRFAGNPLVTADGGIRFYAGAPLVTPSGAALGTLCIIDRVPRRLTPAMAEALRALARQAVRLLELRRTLAALETLNQALRERQQQLEATQRRLDLANRELAEQSLTDALTGLKNRRAFDRLLAEEAARVERARSSVALILLDIDNFKPFNDEFGHVSGDEALRQVAEILQAQVRPYDHVARYGGEEFAIILPDCDLPQAEAMAERIRSEVEGHAWPLRPVTISLGVAACRSVRASTSVVECADKALYQAKERGRNCVVAAEAPSAS